jgi:murein DD-endopeptidase MepM/ murein hydrolase activator NlpD
MRLLAVAFAVAALSAPSAALAAGSGGISAPAPGTSPATPPAEAPADTGGTQPRDERTGRKHRTGPRPVLALFKVKARKLYDLGRPARISFRIDGRSPTVGVKLYVLRRGARIRTIALGQRATGRTHSFALTGREGGRLPEGALQLKLSARDGRGRAMRAPRGASATGSLGFYWHRFPLAGPFTYSGSGGNFGADRPGRLHQGQDLLAASGTPVVAPRGGVVEKVAYQAGGAGNYIVVRGGGENRTYVFMHLLDESTRVREGQRVVTGQRLADVGSTGSSSGAHLHFEIWVGPWFDGGRAIDPLPDLRRWDAWS